MRKNCLIFVFCLLGVIALVAGDDHWVWRRERSFRDIDRTASIRNSYDNKLRREPTTRRPLPGEPENDEIEDYADIEPTTRGTLTPNVGTRQYNPYGGIGGGGGGVGQQNAGQFGVGGGNPGILVGPGGPTGIIGRQPLYPNLYQPGYGGGFNGGYPGVYGGLPGAGVGGGGAGYPGSGYVPGYPGAQLGTGQGLGQYPGGIQYPYPSYPGGDFNGQQFGGGGGVAQYPGGYPGSNQFATGPQYTEGYGLAGAGLGQLGLGGVYPGPGNFAYDEKSATVAEGKSAKSVDISAVSKVSDKLNKKV